MFFSHEGIIATFMYEKSSMKPFSKLNHVVVKKSLKETGIESKTICHERAPSRLLPARLITVDSAVIEGQLAEN